MILRFSEICFSLPIDIYYLSFFQAFQSFSHNFFLLFLKLYSLFDFFEIIISFKKLMFEDFKFGLIISLDVIKFDFWFFIR